MASKKKIAGAIGGGLVGAFALVALHPVIAIATPVVLVGGGVAAGVKAVGNKKKGNDNKPQ